jgi:hypothetical protein
LRTLGVCDVAKFFSQGLKTSNVCVAIMKKHLNFFTTSKPLYFPIPIFLFAFNKGILPKKQKHEKAQRFDKFISSLVCAFTWEAT